MPWYCFFFGINALILFCRVEEEVSVRKAATLLGRGLLSSVGRWPMLGCRVVLFFFNKHWPGRTEILH
jgi:hypothetical protein